MGDLGVMYLWTHIHNFFFFTFVYFKKFVCSKSWKAHIRNTILYLAHSDILGKKKKHLQSLIISEL